MMCPPMMIIPQPPRSLLVVGDGLVGEDPLVRAATQVGQVGAKTTRFAIVVDRIFHSERRFGYFSAPVTIAPPYLFADLKLRQA